MVHFVDAAPQDAHVSRHLAALNRARVRYLVAGGFAVNLHGVPRMTHDLDLYVDFPPANMLRAVRAFGRMGLRPGVPESPEAIANSANRERWRREKDAKVFKFVDPDDPSHPVDVFIYHLVPFDEAWSRRKIVRSEGVRVPLMAIDDIVTLKVVAGREQDLSDILSLRKYEREIQED